MKIKNMPGHRNARRKKALMRLEKVGNLTLIQEIEIRNLKEKIMTFEEARAIRTKKNRSKK